MIVDLVCFILSIVAMFVFTMMFSLVRTNIRYVFMLFNLYALFTFVTSAYDVELYFRCRRIKKNTGSKIALTSTENASIL